MKLKKPIVSILLTCLLCVTAALAFAACSGGNNVRTEKSPEGLLLVLSADKTYYSVYKAGDFSGEDLVVPSEFKDKPVREIGKNAFEDCTFIKTVVIPSSVTHIGSSAFRRCTSLVGVTLPDGLTAIDEYAFCNCKNLTEVAIPGSVTAIGVRAFAYCSALAGLTLGSGINSIDEFAFYGCTALTGITVPSSVNGIGRYAFSGCDKLKSVIFENPSGWSHKDTPVDETELSDPITAARYLTKDFDNHAWSTD